MSKLTEQEILDGFVTPAVIVLAYAIGKADVAIVDKVVAETKKALDKIDTENPPSISEVVDAVLLMARTGAGLTETEVDDKFVDAAEVVNDLIHGKGNAIQALVALLKARSAFKKNGK